MKFFSEIFGEIILLAVGILSIYYIMCEMKEYRTPPFEKKIENVKSK